MTSSQHSPAASGLRGTTVIPVLVYEDIEAAHDFLVGTFGFTSGGIYRSDDGTVVHAEVRAGDRPIWLHRVTLEQEMTSPRGATGSHGGLEIIVPDVDAHFAKTKAAGARIEREPSDQEYGLREYGVRDPENHRWWFSSPLVG
jgi:MerR family transcriptional regulator, thiopeptide resistance regulator